jgi:uncharacterized membrane protein required for colicin V production
MAIIVAAFAPMVLNKIFPYLGPTEFRAFLELLVWFIALYFVRKLFTGLRLENLIRRDRNGSDIS